MEVNAEAPTVSRVVQRMFRVWWSGVSLFFERRPTLSRGDVCKLPGLGAAFFTFSTNTKGTYSYYRHGR